MIFLFHQEIQNISNNSINNKNIHKYFRFKFEIWPNHKNNTNIKTKDIFIKKAKSKNNPLENTNHKSNKNVIYINKKIKIIIRNKN